MPNLATENIQREEECPATSLLNIICPQNCDIKVKVTTWIGQQSLANLVLPELTVCQRKILEFATFLGEKMKKKFSNSYYATF